ncbi:MAG: PAS domain S-box protein [Actinobacteria bacterium]|nr:PAS domain S-box protein [Actinomycetota bacterium]
MRTIKSKLLAIFLLIFTVIAVNSVIAILNFSTLQNSIDNILKANFNSVLYAQNMAIAIERQDSAELAMVFEENKESAKKIYLDNEKEFLGWLAKAEGNITETGENRIVNNLGSFYAEYTDKFTNFETMIGNNNTTVARDYYYNEISPVFENIKQECRNLVEINQSKMIVLKNNSEIIAERASLVALVISSFTIIISIIFMFYLINKIIKPVRDLIQKTRSIAERNYSQQLNIAGKDEIASLANEFNIMASKLRQYDLLNVNQLMKEKQKIETIVESISDGILVTGAENRVLLLNKAAEKIFDIKQQEVIMKHFTEVIKNDDLFAYINEIKSEKNGLSKKEYLDIKVKRKGVLQYFRAISKVITNIEGESIGVVTLLQDITKLKEIDELKSEFISSVSHELRTPITSVIMAAELLEKEIPGKVNKEQKEMLRIVLEDGNRLKNLINDILDLSRLQSSKVDLDLKPNNLSYIADSAIKMFNIQIKEQQIDIVKTIDKKLPLVMVEFGKISQVFANLINNSINYKNENKKLVIKIGAHDKDGKLVVFVADNGRGISEEDQKRIFERFVRIESAESFDSKNGSGLGLAISKSIIKNHGGKMWVESRLMKGSTFYFTLNTVENKKTKKVLK